jgi:hypothetical protein
MDARQATLMHRSAGYRECEHEPAGTRRPATYLRPVQRGRVRQIKRTNTEKATVVASCGHKHVIPVEYRPSRFDTNTAKEPYSTSSGGGGNVGHAHCLGAIHCSAGDTPSTCHPSAQMSIRDGSETGEDELSIV